MSYFYKFQRNSSCNVAIKLSIDTLKNGNSRTAVLSTKIKPRLLRRKRKRPMDDVWSTDLLIRISSFSSLLHTRFSSSLLAEKLLGKGRPLLRILHSFRKLSRYLDDKGIASLSEGIHVALSADDTLSNVNVARLVGNNAATVELAATSKERKGRKNIFEDFKLHLFHLL
jgi:hypothetical protein